MKRVLYLAAAVLAAIACSGKQESKELYVPKGTVEFAGNAFTAFSLGADVKLYTAPNPDNNKEWVVQAVVPIRKETKSKIGSLEINLVPLDDRSIRVRDGFTLIGEDLENLVPVYNSGDNVERTVVFSVSEDGRKKYFTYKEANELLSKTKGVRMDFNSGTAVSGNSTSFDNEPLSVNSLCKKYGVYGLLSSYDNALRNDNKKRANQIENQLWSIEKKIKNDSSIPERIRDAFVDYIEDKEDEIEDKY